MFIIVVSGSLFLFGRDYTLAYSFALSNLSEEIVPLERHMINFHLQISQLEHNAGWSIEEGMRDFK